MYTRLRHILILVTYTNLYIYSFIDGQLKPLGNEVSPNPIFQFLVEYQPIKNQRISSRNAEKFIKSFSI